VKWFVIKIREIGWRVLAAIVLSAVFFLYLYNLIKPSVDRSNLVNTLYLETKSAVKEAQLRAELEKDKIGVIRGIYEHKIEKIKKIDDRQKRLNELVDLYEELDFK
jgi:hypothetical protein